MSEEERRGEKRGAAAFLKGRLTDHWARQSYLWLAD
jgi:hypothetical protein